MKHHHEDHEALNNKHYRAADDLYRLGRYSDALKEFELALGALPDDCDTLWAIADCYSELGKPYLAERYFTSALKSCLPGKRTDLLFNLGNSLFDQMKFNQAIDVYRTIPKESSIYKKAQKNLRLAKRKIERY